MATHQELDFNFNEDQMRLKIRALEQTLEKIYLGGGKARIEKQHESGKLTARERIEQLLDPHCEHIEIGALAGHDMYAEHGGCPGAGVVVVIGYVSGRQCIVVANDATVKAGAWFPITGKKNLRAQEIAMENRLPIIYLVDSAGVYLPLQEDIFADKEHFGRIFRNNAKMSAMGITQIAAVMGSCVAGGAYLPIMSDESLIVDKTGTIFLAGSYLVKAAIGEDIDNETLGGATTQTEISGVCDYKVADDAACLLKIRDLISRIGHQPKVGFDRCEAKEPEHKTNTAYGIIPADRSKPYETKSLLKTIVYEGSLSEYKADFGKTLITTYARIEGWSVGIIANNRKVVKNAKGEMQFGGVIYSDSADKAARFIMLCNQKHIPLVFLHDVTGFMVGSKSEHGGIIKDGAKMVNAVSNSVVPKITVVIGNSYGAGNYAMCGRAYGARFLWMWPNARISVMGGEQAASVLATVKRDGIEGKGGQWSAQEEATFKQPILDQYEVQGHPYYASARLWDDGVIDPADTRMVLGLGLSASLNAPIPDTKFGIFRM
jgi:acetyl-CoA carboxylase carboxyltransferase component